MLSSEADMWAFAATIYYWSYDICISELLLIWAEFIWISSLPIPISGSSIKQF